MNRLKAAALVRQHRYRLSKESDYAVARRAEHAYANVAAVMSIIAVCWMNSDGALVFRVLPPVFILAFAGFCYWRSQQFAMIRHEFEDRWPQNISDLDSNMGPQSEANKTLRATAAKPRS
jgi:hypothetical protein